MTIGNHFLIKAIKDKGVTQVELSRLTGVTQQTISKLLMGVHKTPSRATAVKLAEYFKVSTDEIYN